MPYRDRLAKDGLCLLRINPPRVAEVDLVMLATALIASRRDECVQPLDRRTLCRVGTDVCDLGDQSFGEALQADLGNRGE